MLTVAVLLGFADWIATTILVESELFRPLREWVDRRTYDVVLTDEVAESPGWAKVRYLLGCHLCAGTWVALAEACFVQLGVTHGVVDVVLSALVYKSIGHTVLNLNARLAP